MTRCQFVAWRFVLPLPSTGQERALLSYPVPLMPPHPPQPRLCYRDLRSALLLDPKHLQAKMLLQMMVDQAQQALQEASILAVQGLLQHALQRINLAIENNPLDPSLFLFRYWGEVMALGPRPASSRLAIWSQFPQ